jgi:hypothetical protein
MRSRYAVLVLALAAAGCAASAEDPEAVGYVLLDHEAQTAGRLTQGKWEGAPVLPVGLDADEPVAYASSAGRTTFELKPGMLAWVRGPGGAIEWLSLREDVSDERLKVHGSREAAEDLAQRLAGKVEGGGDGLWTIQAPDVLARGSFMNVPAGVQEVAPEPVVDVRPTASPFAQGARLRLSLPEDAPMGVRQAAVVGMYLAGTRALFLDASGGYTMEEACAGDATARGRWRLDGERVVLEGDGGGMSFVYDRGELRESSGLRFSAAIVEGVGTQGGVE